VHACSLHEPHSTLYLPAPWRCAGKDELDQADKIFEIMGSPKEQENKGFFDVIDPKR
jgi:hypothetical protein